MPSIPVLLMSESPPPPAPLLQGFYFCFSESFFNPRWWTFWNVISYKHNLTCLTCDYKFVCSLCQIILITIEWILQEGSCKKVPQVQEQQKKTQVWQTFQDYQLWGYECDSMFACTTKLTCMVCRTDCMVLKTTSFEESRWESGICFQRIKKEIVLNNV